MKQIEIKIVHAAFDELLLENPGRIIGRTELMPRVFGGKVPAAARIFCQQLSNHDFRHSSMVGKSGIKIIDAVIHGKSDHAAGFFFINCSIGTKREPHGSEPKPGNHFSAKLCILHFFKTSCLITYIIL